MSRIISSENEYTCPKCLEGTITVRQINYLESIAECNNCDYKKQYRICET